MSKPFAIIQNDNTLQTFIRVGDRYIEAAQEEFIPLRELAKQMRTTLTPEAFMDTVVEEWRNIEDEE